MISYTLFFILALLIFVINVAVPLLPQQQQPPQFAVCSITDILLSQSDPNRAIKEYFYHSV